MGDVVKRGTRTKPRFYIRYVEADGRRVQRAAKGARTEGEARTLLSAAELRVTQGRVGMERPVEETPEERSRRTITVEQLVAKFTTEYSSPRLKDPEDYRADAKGALKRLDTLLRRPAASLTSLDLERLRDHLLAPEPDGGGYSKATVLNTLAAVSKMYTWARRQRYVDVDNPAKGVERPRPQPSIDYLSRIEAANLLERVEAHAGPVVPLAPLPHLWPMVAVALFAGLRKGEIFGLRWTDVHLDGPAPRIDVMRSYELLPKSGKPRHVPMHPELARILRLWRDASTPNPGNLVFAFDGKMGRGDDNYGLPEALAAAGCHVPAKPWHSLRHTFASHFMMSGGNILTLQKLLGHATLAMTLVYAHLAPDFMATEVARMNYAAPKADVADLGEERRRREANDAETRAPDERLLVFQTQTS